MRIPVTEAKAQLTDLIRRAEAGEDITLPRHDQDVARIVPVITAAMRAERYERLKRIAEGANPTPGPCAARSADFLYDKDGL
jgi:prevent-host-death family protein